MSRPLRIEMAGAIYHITSRGNGREDIYLDDTDRKQWLEILGNVCKRFNWQCYAYCLMDNHYHLVVETLEANLSKGMRHLNGVYTQYFNRAHRSVGHVFQGRYKAVLVEKDRYLLALARYVVLNPVRANAVKNQNKWPWSSYRATIGETKPPDWLSIDWLLKQFSLQRKRAISKYKDFIESGIDEPTIWANLSQQIYLGDEDFIEGMQKKLDKKADLSEIPRIQRRTKEKSLPDYLSKRKDRKQAMFEAYLSGDYTMKQIADYFNIHYSTVSRAIKQAEIENILKKDLTP